MKLIVQIPCLNEEQNISETIAEIPRQIPGVDQVEVLVIDDGSTDRTIARARKAGADHLLSLKRHKGLARAFKAGLDHALVLGADMIVNTDGDHQYDAREIPRLIEPILKEDADVVIGERPIETIQEFPWIKKKTQRIGSAIVQTLAGIEVKDATSGFRAYSREAALRLNVFTEYTYTWESIVQAAKAYLRIVYVPISVNRVTRPSRLVRNRLHYVGLFLATVFRVYAQFKPLKTFSIIGTFFLMAALCLFLRYWYFYWMGAGAGHIQSIIFGSMLAFIGIQSLVLGLLSSLIASNRLLLEDTLYRVKRIELSSTARR